MNQHIPIMTRELIAALRVDDPAVRRLIDGTVGGGGHALALLRAGIEEALCLDRDRSALAYARTRLAEVGDRARLAHGSYVNMAAEAAAIGWESADAILLDLGLSSLQIDDPARGFSFRFDAPLDMRFDGSGKGPTAQDLVDGLPTAELADLFFRYGDERHSRRIARAIAAERPIRGDRPAGGVGGARQAGRAASAEDAPGDQGLPGAAHRRERGIRRRRKSHSDCH